MIQRCLILIFLKNMCFQKKVKNKPLEISIQPVVLHLLDFEKVDFVVKQIQSIVSRFHSIVFLKTLT